MASKSFAWSKPVNDSRSVDLPTPRELYQRTLGGLGSFWKVAGRPESQGVRTLQLKLLKCVSKHQRGMDDPRILHSTTKPKGYAPAIAGIWGREGGGGIGEGLPDRAAHRLSGRERPSTGRVVNG